MEPEIRRQEGGSHPLPAPSPFTMVSVDRVHRKRSEYPGIPWQSYPNGVATATGQSPGSVD
jgi:hypothetical protein